MEETDMYAVVRTCSEKAAKELFAFDALLPG